MSGFQIPGLGFARPNEVLPPLSSAQAAGAPAPTNEEPGKDVEIADAPPATETIASQTTIAETQDKPSADSQPQSSNQSLETPTPATAAAPAAAEAAPRDIDITDAPAQIVADTTPAQAQNNTSAPSAAPSTGPTAQAPSEANGADADSMVLDQPPSPPSITGALEAALGGLDPENAEEVLGQLEARPETNGPDQPAQGAEWEADSSPYESSSESSTSSDSDSDEDSDNEGYELLGVEETARILMETEGGSDDEGGDRAGKAPGGPLRTKNELPDEIIPKPDVTITPGMKVNELGAIEHIVENIILVKAKTTGEYQVLDTGSVLCTAERVVLGAVAETIGKVLQPMYTVHFTSSEEIKELNLEVGTKIFYPVDHASFVFTEPLKAVKGSDASNFHDEEIGDDEMEFSDDEKEAEYKRSLKNKKKARQAGRGGREPHPLRYETSADPGELNYDDDDGPYKPLTRPPGFGTGPVSQESEPTRHSPYRGRGRGDLRGSRGRGRGRDSRGGGGRGYSSSRPSDGYSLPPQGAKPAAPQQSFQPPPPPGWNPQGGPAPPAPAFPFQWPPQPQGSTSSGQAWQPPPPPGWPGSPAQSSSGAAMDPAMIASLMGQLYQNSQQQQQPPQWDGQQGR